MRRIFRFLDHLVYVYVHIKFWGRRTQLGWSEQNNEKLCDLHNSFNIITLTKGNETDVRFSTEEKDKKSKLVLS
jgi:hypothetical protein